MSFKKSVCIVGAGLSGLVCAYNLGRQGFDVQIIEQLNFAGGLLASTRIGKEYIEFLPHHLRKTDRSLLNLCKDLGIQNRILWYDSLWQGHASKKKIGYFSGGFNDLTNALIQNIIDLGGKFYYSSIVTDIVINKMPSPTINLSDSNSVEPFSPVTNTASAAANHFANLSTIFSTSSDKINDDFFINTSETHINNEYKRFCVKALLENNTRIKLDCDYVIFTGSLNQVSSCCNSLSFFKDNRSFFKKIKYKSNFCLLLVLKKKPSEVYFHKFKDGNYPFQRIINHSVCFDDREYGGFPVYLVGDVDNQDSIWGKDDETIMNLYFANYRKMCPSVRKQDIKTWRLIKIKYAVIDEFSQLDSANLNLFNPLDGFFLGSHAVDAITIDSTLKNRMENVVKLSNKISDNISMPLQ